jgi:ribonuclease Z
MATDLISELPDGLHLILCGAGSPLFDEMRSPACTAVIAGDKVYIVDTGSGASRGLSQLRIPQGSIDGIFLTHFHSDHIDGLGELLLQRWIAGARESQVPVYGPTGVDQIVNAINQAYEPDTKYRIAHHGKVVAPPAGAGGQARPFTIPENGKETVLFEDGDLKIISFRVGHSPVQPAVGYRFDYKGRSILISGDTTKSANLSYFSKGVDLLVHEGLSPELLALITDGAVSAGKKNTAKIMRDILDYHTTPLEAAEIARDAQVGHLLFNHIVPPLPLTTMEEIFVDGIDEIYTGPVTVGRDGTLVKLEIGSESIEVVNIL